MGVIKRNDRQATTLHNTSAALGKGWETTYREPAILIIIHFLDEDYNKFNEATTGSRK